MADVPKAALTTLATASGVVHGAVGDQERPAPAGWGPAARSPGRGATSAAAGLDRSLRAVTARLASATRQRESRDALLARTRATIMELERARDELTELITGTTRALPVSSDATADLTSRLDGLREGLIEVRGATDPEIGPAGQGHP